MNEIIKNQKKSEFLAETISKLNYGDVLKHSTIANIIQEDYPSPKYTSTIAKVKKILLNKYNRCIESIVGDGYRVVKPDDYVNHSLRYYKRGFNEMKKGADTLQHAPVKDMSDEGRVVFRRVYDRAVILNASLKGASVELKSLSDKKKHPFALNATHN